MMGGVSPNLLMNEKGNEMNWNQAQGERRHTKGGDRNQLTFKRDILIGQIQENYGIAKKDAEKKVVDWEKTHDPWLIFDFIL